MISAATAWSVVLRATPPPAERTKYTYDNLKPGPAAGIVFVLLLVFVVLLCRSMLRHLRRADEAFTDRVDDDAAPPTPAPTSSAAEPSDAPTAPNRAAATTDGSDQPDLPRSAP